MVGTKAFPITEPPEKFVFDVLVLAPPPPPLFKTVYVPVPGVGVA
jgi:hypothetical protein